MLVWLRLSPAINLGNEERSLFFFLTLYVQHLEWSLWPHGCSLDTC